MAFVNNERSDEPAYQRRTTIVFAFSFVEQLLSGCSLLIRDNDQNA